MKLKTLVTLVLFLSLTATANLFAQENRFDQEIAQISQEVDNKGWSKGSVLFTGSSSIRMWKNLQAQFPEVPIINTGFGGSTAEDLSAQLFPAVLRFEPSKVFIYEGDNDINGGKTATEVMKTLDEIVTRIQKQLPNTTVNLIAAKPSISRWELKTSYLVLNDLMRQYCTAHDNVNFVNVWDIMLDKTGKPRNDIFIEDNLHMNEKGYSLWKEIFTPFLVED
ncbi:GDSL-type esterase/lipase family protein [Algoriphagus machipongonensis]|uniref:Secreted protein n=1 Tax=Algoriphagus machipongonensis TaxID=388413 RepID=A3HZK2_9BACT|nr:GDSL-type esterase/lipase family protein [Algoriphagus machipongonensis]EAZ80688.1 putative secreted protein [Algoriphagus machipongonensis]